MKFDLEITFQITKNDETLEKIKQKYYPMFCYMLNKYKTPNVVYDECYLRSHLNQVLYISLEKFDFKNSEVSFNVYLFGKMRDEMIRILKMMYAKKRYSKNVVYYESPVNYSMCYGDFLKDDPDVEYQVELKESFSYSIKWIKKFLKAEEYKLYMLYINGNNYGQIDAMYKWEKGKAKNKLSYIRKKLRIQAKNHPFYQK